MANALYPLWKQELMQGTANTALTGNVKAVLIDLNDYAAAITGATNATPIVVTSNGHGLSNGMRVSISGVLGNTAANGLFRVNNVTANTFELQTVLGVNVAGNGAYTSGGFLVKLGLDRYLSDIPAGARVAISGNLASKTFVAGLFDAADITFTAVTGDPSEAIALFVDTGSPATSPLVSFHDTAVSGLPATPNGGDINLQFNAAGIFQL